MSNNFLRHPVIIFKAEFTFATFFAWCIPDKIVANLPTQNLPTQSYPTELLHLSLHSNPALHEPKRHRGPG